MARVVSSFSLKPGKPIKHELRRIARKELDGASKRLRRGYSNDSDVHESRKSVKKVEALTRLMDQMGFAPPRKKMKRLRAARRALSRLRDADAMIETFDRLRSRFADRIPEHTARVIRTHLVKEKTTIARRAEASAGSLARAGKALRKLKRSVNEWTSFSIDLSDLPPVLAHSFRASRKAMRQAQLHGRATDYHDWRKSVKDLEYQLRLVERLVAGMGTPIEEFRGLETALGEEHNLVVLRTRLTHDKELRSMKSQIVDLIAMSTALQEELRRAAVVLGVRLFTSSPKQFEKDLRRRLRPGGTPRRKPSPRSRQAVA